MHVSDDESDFADSDEYSSMLQELRWQGSRIHLRCATGRVYELDVSDVDREEAAEARRILRTMNRDGQFRLHLDADGR